MTAERIHLTQFLLADPIYLTEALVLLLFPLGLFFGKGVALRRYSTAQVSDELSLARAWGTVPVLWLDPLRAYLGTLLLSNDNFALRLQAGVKGGAHQPLFVTVGVLAVALLVQMFAVRQSDEDNDALLAPVGFTLGMIFALMPSLPVAVMATVVAVTSAAAFRSWYAFFLGGAAAIAGTGALLIGRNVWVLGPPILLLIEPVIICVVARREFVIPMRRQGD